VRDWALKRGLIVGLGSVKGNKNASNLGKLPPDPPGFDPTPGSGWEIIPSNKSPTGWGIIDPYGNWWQPHPEDNGHWAHWDLFEKGAEKGVHIRVPESAFKPVGQTRPGQSATNPNSGLPEFTLPNDWRTRMKMPRDEDNRITGYPIIRGCIQCGIIPFPIEPQKNSGPQTYPVTPIPLAPTPYPTPPAQLPPPSYPIPIRIPFLP
jgi:hypothetical protein